MSDFKEPPNDVIPRAQTRGPIEAEDVNMSQYVDTDIPRAQTRGPIEADRLGDAIFQHKCIPRAQTRGPIEAKLRPGLRASSCAFREHKLAAPLKQGIKEVGGHAKGSIPRAQTRGPIEACWVLEYLVRAGFIPRAQTRGPIEAIMIIFDIETGPMHSASTNSRPH